ncbi:head-tail connector protein [Sphingomonadaceae bacterium G21617-S1]|nr:head-tail connector protein [Sphingomonadaceae bacterium G21617-S1]
MWYPAFTTGAPTGEVVDLESAKLFLRVDGDDEDSFIAGAIAAAIQHVESYTGTRLLEQTVELRAGAFADLNHLPIGPIRSISAITYLDFQGVAQTMAPERYSLCGAGLERGIRPAFAVTWPSTWRVADALTVTAIVGYGEAEIPAPVKQAILLLLGDYYTNRQDTVIARGGSPAPMPNGVETLLANFRLFG